MRSETPSARLIIADDQALIREGIQAMLESEPDLEVVGEATNGQEALELCRKLCPATPSAPPDAAPSGTGTPGREPGDRRG